MSDHGHAAGKIFHRSLKILLQPLLCPAFFQFLSRIAYIFDVRRGPIPVCYPGPRRNVLCMGHMASDSIGFNQILDAWEARGVEVTRIGGLV